VDAVVDAIVNRGAWDTYDRESLRKDDGAKIPCDGGDLIAKGVPPGHLVKLGFCQFDRFTKDLFHCVAPFSITSNAVKQILPPAARNPTLQRASHFC
jgi:hypothetical protein